MSFRQPLVINAGNSQQLQSGDYVGQVEQLSYIKDEPFVIDSGDIYLLGTGVLWADATISPYLAQSDYDPPTSFDLFDGTTTQLMDDAFIIDSGVLVDAGGNPATLLWTDAARCPQTINTLLIIGI